jgi:hypothetical protein
VNLEDLERAVKLKDELALWERALVRLDRNIFKTAELSVTDASHGHMGQQSQSKIALDRDVVTPWVKDRIEHLRFELAELGIRLE